MADVSARIDRAPIRGIRLTYTFSQLVSHPSDGCPPPNRHARPGNRVTDDALAGRDSRAGAACRLHDRRILLAGHTRPVRPARARATDRHRRSTRPADPALKHKLERVVAIRNYASRELALPDNLSYRRYADLDRRFVLWNVFAAPELSLKPLQWCFPIAGCVNYRGYFSEAAARAEAAELAAAGDDVHVGGVPAYSTLGYFADPMLSTFIRYPGHRDRAADLPRARAPGRLREGRHGVQRVVRRLGRAGGAQALARGAERSGADCAIHRGAALS